MLSSLTCSGWFTHNSGHPSAAGRAQDVGSSPAKDRRSTTVLRNQSGMADPKISGVDMATPRTNEHLRPREIRLANF